MPPRSSFDEDDDWTGTPPEGRHTRDRARPDFWRSQRPPAIAAAGLAIVILVLVIVLLVN